MRPRLCAVSLLLLAALTACGNDDPQPTTAPASPAAAVTSSTTKPATDPLGRDACADLRAANAADSGRPDLPALAAIAAQGARSQDRYVSAGAQSLGKAVEMAQAATSATETARANAAVNLLAGNMEDECVRAGY